MSHSFSIAPLVNAAVVAYGARAGAPAAGHPAASSKTAGAIAPAVTATQLVVTTPPPNPILAGVPFGLVVAAEDGSGNVDTSYDGSVTVSYPSEDQTLDGTLTVNAVDGVATFSGLTLDYERSAGNDESLEVCAAGFANVYYTPVVVTSCAAEQFSVFPPTSPVQAGTPFSVTVRLWTPWETPSRTLTAT